MLNGELSPALRGTYATSCGLKGRANTYELTGYLIFYIDYLTCSSIQLYKIEIVISTSGKLGFEPRSI